MNPLIPSDETLVKEFMSGQPEAFAELYDRYCAPVTGYIYKRKALSTREERDELVQEVFAEALALLPTFREDDYDEHPFRKWLFNIPAGNVLFQDRKRHWAVRECYLRAADDLAFQMRTNVVQPTDVRLSSKLRSALDALRPHYRQAIELHVLEGQWLMTAGSVMGRDSESVRYLVRAALKELRDPSKPKMVRGERRAALLTAVRALLAERDAASISDKDIAAAAGCSDGLIRYYFGSQQALLAEAMSELDLAERAI